VPETAAAPASTAHPSGYGTTHRADNWRLGPWITFGVLASFVVYSTGRAVFHGGHFEWGSLLSPFFSPLIVWDGMPSWLSPAFLILWAPGGFRLTCYYYRKAYYRAMFADPHACGVGEAQAGPWAHTNYCGETRFPFILQNLHRYFMYLALVFNVILWIDAIKAFFWKDGFHVSVGTLVLTANAFLLMGYSLSCHSLRHLVGGKVDCFAKAAMGECRYMAWKGASWMNERHMLWAWTSLFVVGFADFYVWMVASGRWTDLRIF
jgi:hypothetical protein